MSGQYSKFLGDIIAETDLATANARRIASFIKLRPELGAKLVELRRNEHGHDTIIIEMAADIPQRPAHDIRDTEPLAITLTSDDDLPMVFALREEFPQAPHTNDMPNGAPIALCLYRDGWTEVRLSWTPGKFVQKIRWWLEETAMGGLYGEGNPIEPLFFSPPIHIAVARDVFEERFQTGAEAATLVLRPVGDRNGGVCVLQRSTDHDRFHQAEPLTITFAEAVTPVITDGRVRIPPHDLPRLLDFMDGIGFNLATHLRAQLAQFMDKPELRNSQFGLLIAARLASEGEPRNQLICFISTRSIAETAVALGEFAPSKDGLPPGYLLEPDHTKRGEGIDLTPANVAIALDPREAATLSGKPTDERKIALAGAGALGSALFEIYTRQGFGKWTTIDKDHLLTHNLARHALQRGLLGGGKASGLASLAGAVLGDKHRAQHLDADVTDPGDKSDELRKGLDEADLIIDATASAAAARALAADPATARRVSLFLLGDARAIVVLVEDVERKARLDDLESNLVAHAIADARVAEQFADLPTQIATPASCRAPTSRAPWSRIVTLAGVAAEFLRTALNKPDAAIKVFRWRAEEGVDAIDIQASPYIEHEITDWTVRVSASVLEDLRHKRIAALPNETGGVLIGATDTWNKVVHIAAHVSDFTDSVGTPTSFQRGLAGLPKTLGHIASSTHGALAYVGEWHSHPDGVSATPSGLDVLQLAGLAETLRIDDRPALSLIIANNEERILLGSFTTPSAATSARA